MQLFLYLAFQPCGKIFPEIYVAAGHLVNAGQKLFGCRPFGQENLFDAAKVMMNKSAGGDDLLACGGGFAVVNGFVGGHAGYGGRGGT